MNVFIEFISFSTIVSICVGVTIRHYPNITVPHCGIERISSLTNDKCFEWHKSIDIMNGLRNGKIVSKEEMPFTALVRVEYGLFGLKYLRCSGSILNNHWIITAAHCLKCLEEKTCSESDFKIYPGLRDKEKMGEYHTMKRGVLYLRYFPNKRAFSDIGLIELNKGIQFIKKSNYYEINAICLPEAEVRNTENEYAIVAGYGHVGKDTESRYLRKGFVVVQGPAPGDRRPQLDMNQLDAKGASYTFAGDSGGPVIQYDSGRAVQIGVLSRIVGMSSLDYEDGNYPSEGPAMYAFVYWIKCVITGSCEECGLQCQRYAVNI